MDVRIMSADDAASAIDTVVLGFAADPVSRWAWPHPHQYMSAMTPFAHAFAGAAFAHEGAFCTDDYIGVALWLPPGAHPDSDRMDEIMAVTASPSARTDGPAIFEQMAQLPSTRAALVSALHRRGPRVSGQGPRRFADGVCARALRRRQAARVSGIDKLTQHVPVPAPRLRGAWDDTGGLRAAHRADAAAGALRHARGRQTMTADATPPCLRIG